MDAEHSTPLVELAYFLCIVPVYSAAVAELIDVRAEGFVRPPLLPANSEREKKGEYYIHHIAVYCSVLYTVPSW